MRVVLWAAEDLSSCGCRRRPQTRTCWSCRCAVPRSDLTARKWLGPADTSDATVSLLQHGPRCPSLPWGLCSEVTATARPQSLHDCERHLEAGGMNPQLRMSSSLPPFSLSSLAKQQPCLPPPLPAPHRKQNLRPLALKSSNSYRAKTRGSVRCSPDLILSKRNCTRGFPVNSRVYFPSCYSGPVNPSTAVPLGQRGRGQSCSHPVTRVSAQASDGEPGTAKREQQSRILTWLPSQPRQQQLTDTLGRHGLTSSWHLLGCRGGDHSPASQLSTLTPPKTPHPLNHSPGRANCSCWGQAEDRSAASTEQKSNKTGGSSMARELQLPQWTPPAETSTGHGAATTYQVTSAEVRQEGKGLSYLGTSGGGELKRESF